jgi:type IV pilus assembly protein PilW
MQVYDNQRTPNIQPAYPLAPVYIVSNAGTTPDLVRVIYGQSTLTTASVQLMDMSTVTDTFTLPFRYGFNVGDLLVVGQAGQYCTLAEISALVGPNDIAHGVGTITVGAATRTVRFNNPAGVPWAYKFTQNAKVANLGPLPAAGAWPVYDEFSVTNNSVIPATNNKLNVANLWAQIATPNPIADQIVHMKAEYGVDDGVSNGTVPARVYAPDDNIIDNFTTVSPPVIPPSLANMRQWQRIKMVRLAVVSRSANTVDPTTGKGTACDATPAFDPSLATNVYPVRWARGPDAPYGKPIDVRTSADWQCYKYKVYETTIPLRNVLWRQP